MAQVRVDTDGLRSAAAGLSHTAVAGGGAPRCEPASADPVSVSVAAALTQWSHALWTVMEHAGRLRAAGGMSLGATTQFLGALDDAGAAKIVGSLAGSPSAAGPASLPSGPPVVPAPTLPEIPQIMAPPPLTGEQISALVHDQADPDRLRAFANQWRTQVAPHILADADHTRRYGASVAQAWDSGSSPAADNIAQHADWLASDLHPGALKLAAAADEAAGHAETVIQHTPTPQEFHAIRQHLQTAVKHYEVSGDPSEVNALLQQLGEKQTAAVAGYQTYAAAAPASADGAADTPKPAPPIARGTGPGDSEQQADQLKPGARGHNSGAGDEPGKGTGLDTQRPSTADVGPPWGQSGQPPIAPAQQQPIPPQQPIPAPTSPAQATPMMANIAGTIMGAGLGTAGNVANSVHGIASSPLSALSGLSSLGGLPHMGGPQTPSGDNGAGDSMPDLGHDFGSGGTTPAGGGGDGGVGGPVSGATPPSGTVSAANPTVGTPAGMSPGGASPTVGGGSGMFAPPMMGGLGRENDERKAGDKRRRVVMRTVGNSEPVFGEVQRQRTTARRPKDER